MLSPLSLFSKIIGVLARNGGEKRNQHHYRVGSMSLLNMALVCIRVGLGTSHLIFHLPLWVWVIPFDLSSSRCLVTMTFDPLMSNTAKSIVVPFMCSREVGLCKYQPSSVSHMVLIHNKTLCSSVSCRWCGNHYGPPSIKVTSCRLQLIIQEADLETPFWYLGACMPQWQVRHIWWGVFIIGLRSSDSMGVRRQLIYSHAVDCTCSTLRAIVIIGGSSRVY